VGRHRHEGDGDVRLPGHADADPGKLPSSGTVTSSRSSRASRCRRRGPRPGCEHREASQRAALYPLIDSQVPADETLDKRRGTIERSVSSDVGEPVVDLDELESARRDKGLREGLTELFEAALDPAHRAQPNSLEWTKRRRRWVWVVSFPRAAGPRSSPSGRRDVRPRSRRPPRGCRTRGCQTRRQPPWSRRKDRR
jgi:hypothetical protein